MIWSLLATLILTGAPSNGLARKVFSPTTQNAVPAQLHVSSQDIVTKVELRLHPSPKRGQPASQGKVGNVGQAYHLELFLPDINGQFSAYSKIGDRETFTSGWWFGRTFSGIFKINEALVFDGNAPYTLTIVTPTLRKDLSGYELDLLIRNYETGIQGRVLLHLDCYEDEILEPGQAARPAKVHKQDSSQKLVCRYNSENTEVPLTKIVQTPKGNK